MELPCSSSITIILFFSISELHISSMPSSHIRAWSLYWECTEGMGKKEGMKERGRERGREGDLTLKSTVSLPLILGQKNSSQLYERHIEKKISKFMNMQLLLRRQIAFLPKCSKMHSFSEYITFIILCGTLNENFPDLATEHIFIFQCLTQSPG